RYYEAVDAQKAERDAKAVREQIAALRPPPAGPAAEALARLDKKLEAGLSANLSAGLARVMSTLTQADVRPTAVQLAAVSGVRVQATATGALFRTAKVVELPAANAALKA